MSVEELACFAQKHSEYKGKYSNALITDNLIPILKRINQDASNLTVAEYEKFIECHNKIFNRIKWNSECLVFSAEIIFKACVNLENENELFEKSLTSLYFILTLEKGIKDKIDTTGVLGTLKGVFMSDERSLHCRRVAVEVTNLLLADSTKNKLTAVKDTFSVENCKYLAKSLASIGDYEIQNQILQILFRLRPKNASMQSCTIIWNDEQVSKLFMEIQPKNFAENSRSFLNFLNKTCEHRLVHSFEAALSDGENENIWVDFNCNSVTFNATKKSFMEKKPLVCRSKNFHEIFYDNITEISDEGTKIFLKSKENHNHKTFAYCFIFNETNFKSAMKILDQKTNLLKKKQKSSTSSLPIVITPAESITKTSEFSSKQQTPKFPSQQEKNQESFQKPDTPSRVVVADTSFLFSSPPPLMIPTSPGYHKSFNSAQEMLLNSPFQNDTLRNPFNEMSSEILKEKISLFKEPIYTKQSCTSESSFEFMQNNKAASEYSIHEVIKKLYEIASKEYVNAWNAKTTLKQSDLDSKIKEIHKKSDKKIKSMLKLSISKDSSIYKRIRRSKTCIPEFKPSKMRHRAINVPDIIFWKKETCFNALKKVRSSLENFESITHKLLNHNNETSKRTWVPAH